MDGCLFCAIVAGDVPADVVRRDEVSGLWLAFRDVSPQAPTHVLIVPTTHAADAAALADQEPETVVELVKAAAAVAAEEGAEDYRLVFNTGAGAGQSVFHAHLHLLAGRSFTWPPG